MRSIIEKIIIIIIAVLQSLGVSDLSENVNFENVLLTEINCYRISYGLNELKLSSDLCIAANIRASEIIDKWSHTRPDGTKFDVLINKFDWDVAGENLAKCSENTDGSVILQAWINSEPHRINIVNSRFQKCGIGFYKQNDTLYIALILTN